MYSRYFFAGSYFTGFVFVAFLLLLCTFLFFFLPEEKSRKKRKEMIHRFKGVWSRNLKGVAVITFIAGFSFYFSYFPGFFILLRSIGISESELFIMLLLLYVFSAIFLHVFKRRIEDVNEQKLLVLCFTIMSAGVFGYALFFYIFYFC